MFSEVASLLVGFDFEVSYQTDLKLTRLLHQLSSIEKLDRKHHIQLANTF